MANPIWKDYYVNLGSADSAEFSISVGGSIIYSGKAYKRPGDDNISIKINDICADYLEGQKMQDGELIEGFIPADIATEFKVLNSIGSLIESVTFVNDWSYDYDKQDDGVLSAPINAVFDVRMPLLYSVSKAQVIEIDAQDTHADFNIDFSKDFYVGFDRTWKLEAGAAGTAILKAIFENHGEVKVGKTKYLGITSCATHALYYINAYGGWDFLLMQGRTIETDVYSRKVFKRGYDNRSVQNRGTVNHINEINKTYVLHTGHLLGDQGQRMHHLLGSTDVFMFDIANQRMIPVVINDGECRYKSYGSEGGRLVDYEISVSVAQNRMRR